MPRSNPRPPPPPERVEGAKPKLLPAQPLTPPPPASGGSGVTLRASRTPRGWSGRSSGRSPSRATTRTGGAGARRSSAPACAAGWPRRASYSSPRPSACLLYTSPSPRD
eukprot:6286404-Alexandrium_andersonii.AAC.1